jgi:hypothetical protein
MNLGSLCLGLYLLLLGLNYLAILTVNNTLLGVLALIAGAAILLDSWHPITVWRRNPNV